MRGEMRRRGAFLASIRPTSWLAYTPLSRPSPPSRAFPDLALLGMTVNFTSASARSSSHHWHSLTT